MLFSILTQGDGMWVTLITLAAYILALLIAFVLHEYAHAFAALKSGDPTAKMMGRLSLNPARHFEPLGFLSFLIIGFGWGKPVPINQFNYRNFRRGNFWVSIAGVLTNLIIGFICSFGYFIILKYGNFDNLLILGLGMFFMYCMVINLWLMVFNLIPVPPLDGFNLLASFAKPNNRFMQFMRQNSSTALIILFVVFILFGNTFSLVSPIIYVFEKFWGLFI